MSSKPILRLDWCSHQAAKYAVEHWHYSQKMPKSKLAKIGVWEDNRFIGVVIYGRGANNNIGSAYKVKQTEVCELVRIALTTHTAPVSQIVALAMRMLRKQSPGVRLIVSYADPAQDHHGGIYQAMNWTYTGTSWPQPVLLVAGKFVHKRVAFARWGTASTEAIHKMIGMKVERGPVEWKHTYLYPLDTAMREQIAPLAKPYPKRPRPESVDSDTSTFHVEEGSATLTSGLHGDTDRTLEAAR
ncbi:MAG: protein Mom [Thermomicrobiales bacterium]